MKNELKKTDALLRNVNTLKIELELTGLLQRIYSSVRERVISLERNSSIEDLGRHQGYSEEKAKELTENYNAIAEKFEEIISFLPKTLN